MSYKIGIIGSGNIGQGLAVHLSKTNYQVLLANSRGPESLQELVASIGGSLKAGELRETIRQSDVIFIAVPWTGLTNLAKEFNGYEGKIIVDATNNIVSVSPFSLADLGGKSTGEFVADLLPAQKIVKAFNTLSAATLAQPTKSTDGTTVIVISGDDPEAKKQVATIAEGMGFAPVDLGTFNEAGKIQDVGGALSGIELIKVKKA
jgi:predicted dinucleotide-binding enzyme